jgi:putative DNA primase/helicase
MLGEPFTERDSGLLALHGLTLADAHAAQLRKVNDEEGAQLVGQSHRRSADRDFSGIAFPYLRGDRVIDYRLRRNNPDLEQQADGLKERNKYLSAPGTRAHLYFLGNLSQEWLDDHTIDIAITEGEWKTLALHRLAFEHNAGGRPRWLAIGLAGVWNFRGRIGRDTNANGKRVDIFGAIPDLDSIRWAGRCVKVVFDSDVRSNSMVTAARIALGVELSGRGAIVEFVDVPDSPHGGKWGLDDWLGNAGPEPVLEALSYGKIFKASAENVIVILDALPKEPSLIEIEQALSAIARILVKVNNQLVFALVREGIIRALKARKVISAAKIVDAALDDCGGEEASGPSLFEETEPWPEAVDGVELLSEIVKALKHFLFASEVVYSLVAVWSVFTHAFDSFDCLPNLLITAPTKGAGKSTLLTLLKCWSRKGLLVSSMTAAVLYRITQNERPTLLLDEADTYLKDNEALRGIINSGHTRSTAVVPRCEGEDNEVKLWSTFYPKAMAGIGAVAPDTVEDRSIRVDLERASGVEQRGLEYLTLDKQKELAHLRSKAARWALDNAHALRRAEPDIPDELTNARMRDNFRPLFAVANVVGGEWPTLVRQVAVAAAGFGVACRNSELLIQDIYAYVESSALTEDDYIESSKLATFLHDIEDRPWAEYGRQRKPITPTGIAYLLKEFKTTSGYKLRPVHERAGGTTWRGYWVSDFANAFARYCRPGTNGTQPRIKNLHETSPQQIGESVPSRKGDKPLKTNGCADCAGSEAAGANFELPLTGRVVL